METQWWKEPSRVPFTFTISSIPGFIIIQVYLPARLIGRDGSFIKGGFSLGGQSLRRSCGVYHLWSPLNADLPLPAGFIQSSTCSDPHRSAHRGSQFSYQRFNEPLASGFPAMRERDKLFGHFHHTHTYFYSRSFPST